MAFMHAGCTFRDFNTMQVVETYCGKLSINDTTFVRNEPFVGVVVATSGFEMQDTEVSSTIKL